MNNLPERLRALMINTKFPFYGRFKTNNDRTKNLQLALRDEGINEDNEYLVEI